MQPLSFYKELRKRTVEVSISLEKKLTKAVDAKFSPDVTEDVPTFLYFNKTSFALMHSVSVTKDMLSTDLRYYSNRVVRKLE